MRTSFETILICLLLGGLTVACNTLELRLYQTKSRADCTERGGSGGTSSSDSTSPDAPVVIPDTLLLFAAVDFARGYDWCRDTAYGSSKFDVVLYKDFVETLRLSSSFLPGLSPAANTHHIIDGDLYTEHFSSGETSLYKNGARLFGFEGREIMVGILPHKDGVYTLSRKLSGENGTLFRLNGEILSEFSSGKPFGSLEDPSCEETGALYSSRGEGGEEVYFCFDSEGKVTKTRYLAVYKDHTDTIPNSQGTIVADVKILNGEIFTCRNYHSSYSLQDAKIYKDPGEKGYFIGAYFTIGSRGQFTGIVDYSRGLGKQSKLCSGEAFVYHSASDNYAIEENEETDGVSIYNKDGFVIYTSASAYFPSPGSATLRGGYFAAAVSSKNKDSPYPKIVLRGGESREIPINGYISDVTTALEANHSK